jgi:hypothetical protein
MAAYEKPAILKSVDRLELDPSIDQDGEPTIEQMGAAIALAAVAAAAVGTWALAATRTKDASRPRPPRPDARELRVVTLPPLPRS